MNQDCGEQPGLPGKTVFFSQFSAVDGAGHYVLSVVPQWMNQAMILSKLLNAISVVFVSCLMNKKKKTGRTHLGFPKAKQLLSKVVAGRHQQADFQADT